MTFSIISIIFIGFRIVSSTQHSPYSLQAAVDALHRREEQLALDEPGLYENQDFIGMGPGSVPSDYHGNRQQINKMLANFIDNDTPNDIYDNYPNQYENLESNYEADKWKRSMFRERENPNLSVFRERDQDARPDLAEEFLREIDRERNLAREKQYRDQLKNMWHKYQQQENEIERDLFNELGNEQLQHETNEPVVPLYWETAGNGAKKRAMPLLPWLPATRKKRFPVAKRSPKNLDSEASASGTNEKVAKDLQAIFTDKVEEKKKRSSGDDAHGRTNMHKNADHRIAKKSDHTHDDDHEHDDDEHSQEHEEEDHYHEHSEEEDEDFEDEEMEKRKREVPSKKKSNLEVVKEEQILPGDISDKKKKSIEWNQYFGLDRRKKSYPMSTFPMPYFKGKDEKKIYNEDKLNKMDQKLKNIEDLIIDETVKYTGAHEGISEPEEIEKLKDHVVSRLATAYSLEKMRRALAKLKQSVDEDKHVQMNEIPGSDKRGESNNDKKEKRVAAKKEKVTFDNNDHKIESTPSKVNDEPKNSLDEGDDSKKKRNNVNAIDEILNPGRIMPMSEGYMGGRSTIEQCPILEGIERRCRGVDVLSGDIQQNLLPLCEAHQLCYICSFSQNACDYQYLSQADRVCDENTECKSAVRAALLILRGLPVGQLGSAGCAKNPCLFHAVKELGF